MKFVVGNKEFSNMEEAQKYENELKEKEMKKQEMEKEKESRKNEIAKLSRVIEDKVNSFKKDYGEMPDCKVFVSMDNDSDFIDLFSTNHDKYKDFLSNVFDMNY